MAIDERTVNGRLSAVETDGEWIKRELLTMKADVRWLRDRAILIIGLIVVVAQLVIPPLSRAVGVLFQ